MAKNITPELKIFLEEKGVLEKFMNNIEDDPEDDRPIKYIDMGFLFEKSPEKHESCAKLDKEFRVLIKKNKDYELF